MPDNVDRWSPVQPVVAGMDGVTDKIKRAAATGCRPTARAAPAPSPVTVAPGPQRPAGHSLSAQENLDAMIDLLRHGDRDQAPEQRQSRSRRLVGKCHARSGVCVVDGVKDGLL
jgi:hypothetical protein